MIVTKFEINTLEKFIRLMDDFEKKLNAYVAKNATNTWGMKTYIKRDGSGYIIEVTVKGKNDENNDKIRYSK